MPTFKTARDTVVLQSGFRGDESYRSSPRDAGVRPPAPQPPQLPGPLQAPQRAHGSRDHRGGSRAEPGLSLSLRKACQASAGHVKLPVPEPAPRAAREPPTEGTPAPTPPRPSGFHPERRPGCGPRPEVTPSPSVPSGPGRGGSG